jgi:hypothetical protein
MLVGPFSARLMMRRLAFCLPFLLASTLFALPACGGDGDGGDGGGGGGGGETETLDFEVETSR